ncbi:MAG: transketolase [Chloroflexi bacterium]|nr:transketolase [Chloroflexota bacterium]
MPTTDQLCINAIRFLAVDAIQKADSGHPGAPMGMAPVAYVLWDRFLKHNPADPNWPDRDRFILSAGHASAMLYALLHLTGYDLSIEELKRFRQWQSKTPGHPEYGLTPGVEMTTGPLGQGFSSGVGMAIAAKLLAGHYNRPARKTTDHDPSPDRGVPLPRVHEQPGYEIIGHYIYAIVSDGDLMEGISSEAASIAGTLKLGKLIYLYDDNDISIEGHTDITFTEDVKKRFEAYHWHVAGPVDGADLEAVDRAIREAQAETERPSLIICRTVIGCGSPNKAGTAGVHGEPLGEKEICLTRENLAWAHEPFQVPPDVLAHFRQARERGKRWQQVWENKLASYRQAYPKEAEQLTAELEGSLPEGWDEGLDGLFAKQSKPIATRAAGGEVLNALAPRIHALTGGSADLAPSTKTLMKNRGDFGLKDYSGHNLHFGVREHAMGAIANGMALHRGIIPYASTFLVFYDYMRAPVRLAAFMGLRVIFIFTHDSVGVGEDGPTHQPIEQLLGLRAVPNLVTLRPADATETAEAWRVALRRTSGPTAFVLSRQNLPVLDRKVLPSAGGVQKGGYVLWEASSASDVIIIGTGSEVHIAMEAAELLEKKGIAARVVSMPSWELFDAQPAEYRNAVLPPSLKARISIEAGTTIGWERYIGLDGIAIGVNRFGASAPQKVVYEKLGLTAEHVVEAALKLASPRV